MDICCKMCIVSHCNDAQEVKLGQWIFNVTDTGEQGTERKK